MRRVNDGPLDPRDPSPSDLGSGEISAAAEQAREQLRGEFEQLRVEIGGLDAEASSGEPPVGGGFRSRARASLAVLALTAAVAAAAANFALNGGRTPNAGSVSVPPTSPESEPGVITADRGSAEKAFPLLSLIPPGLQVDTLDSSAGLAGAGAPFTGPSPLFVVGEPVPVGAHGSPGEDVGGSDPVGRSPKPSPEPSPTASPTPSPTSTPPLAAADPPQQVGSSSPPAPGGGPGGDADPGDDPDDGKVPASGPGDGGEDPDDGGKPGHGGGNSGNSGGGGGDGVGNGHIKARGKGHGGSSGNGHEKDQGGGEVADTGSGDTGSPGASAGGRGRGKKKGAPAPVTETPAPPSPPVGGPPSGSNGTSGKSEDHGNGHGKSTAPGQVGK
jgi:hypothetical protein